VPIECRRGPQLLYINKEADAGLVEAIHYRASRGMCIGTAEFRELVRQAALETSLKEIPDTFPGIKWIQRWVKRHEGDISYRKGRILDAKRAECSTESTVRYYFTNLKTALNELGIKNCPQRIWNCDETGVTAQGRCSERVLCPKGKSANIRRSSDRGNVSIMGCCNAAGEFMPPMYIFSGVRRKMQWLEGSPAGSVCAVTESSNINTDLFLIWFKWFITMLPASRPQLLVLDGHFAHVSLMAVKYGMQRDVHLFVLPAHTSHFLQPLDVGVFQPFKALYDKAIKQYPIAHHGALPTKDNIAALTHEPFKNAFSTANIRKGFSSTGIYPLSLEVMMSGIIGQAPSTTSSRVRHHAVLAPLFDGDVICERVQLQLKRRRLSLDTLNVAKISLRMLIEPMAQPRSKGNFVDEKVSGGKLLTYADMKEVVDRRAAVAAEKKAVKEAAALHKAAAKEVAAKRKAEAKEKAAILKTTRESAAKLRAQAKKQRVVSRRAIKETSQHAPIAVEIDGIMSVVV